MATLRRLIVMRHAKAEPYGKTDQERELSRRGRADAADAGAFLRAIGVVPDHALVSVASRTRQTWEEVSRACGGEAVVDFDSAVYSGGPDDVLERLREIPADVEISLFVGHNPTAAYLAHFLDDGDGDPDALREMLHGYPAGALTVFELAGDWSDIDEGKGRVTHFHAVPEAG